MAVALDQLRAHLAGVRSKIAELCVSPMAKHLRANRTVGVAGLEGKYYVRGAFALDANLATIRAGHEPDLALLLPENLDRVWRAAVAGWRTHHPGQSATFIDAEGGLLSVSQHVILWIPARPDGRCSVDWSPSKTMEVSR